MGEPIVCHSDDPNTAGVLGEGPTGVYGSNTLGVGNGVIGYSDAGRGVWGHSNQTGIGVLGAGAKGVGVMGTSQENAGMLGEGATGVYGHNNVGIGNGIIGYSDAGRGVWGHSNQTGIGVLGESATGIGIQGKGGHRAGFFDGDVEVTGDIQCPNGDCAEDFDMAGTTVVDPGTVMVLDSNGALVASARAYDRCVAGVLSGAGTYRPAIVLDKQSKSNGNRQPLALVGKVFCKVDADFGAIAVGDLLTTSATPGHAMVATDVSKAFGAVLGKALRPLNEGRGLIPILIALQ